jgi:hypothetical protein
MNDTSKTALQSTNVEADTQTNLGIAAMMKDLDGLLDTPDNLKNIVNIGKLEEVMEIMQKKVARAKVKNAPKEFGVIDAGAYVLTYKQGGFTVPLSTAKIVGAIAEQNPHLLVAFSQGLTVTKKYLSDFSKAHDLNLPDCEDPDKAKARANTITVTLKKAQ